MPEEICPSCGARNPAGTEFCQACGTYLRWDATTTDLPAVAQPAAPAAAPPQPVPGPVAAPSPDPPVSAPQAVPPSATPAPIPKQPQPAAPPPVESGQTRCPRCGTANPPERRFC